MATTGVAGKVFGHTLVDQKTGKSATFEDLINGGSGDTVDTLKKIASTLISTITVTDPMTGENLDNSFLLNLGISTAFSTLPDIAPGDFFPAKYLLPKEIKDEVFTKCVLPEVSWTIDGITNQDLQVTVHARDDLTDTPFLNGSHETFPAGLVYVMFRNMDTQETFSMSKVDIANYKPVFSLFYDKHLTIPFYD